MEVCGEILHEWEEAHSHGDGFAIGAFAFEVAFVVHAGEEGAHPCGRHEIVCFCESQLGEGAEACAKLGAVLRERWCWDGFAHHHAGALEEDVGWFAYGIADDDATRWVGRFILQVGGEAGFVVDAARVMIEAEDHEGKVGTCALQLCACGPAALGESFCSQAAHDNPAMALLDGGVSCGADDGEDIFDGGALSGGGRDEAFAMHGEVGVSFAKIFGLRHAECCRGRCTHLRGRGQRRGGSMLSRLFAERVLVRELWVPKRVEDVFPFFADAANLNTLTPPWLKFEILTPLPIDMRAGALIDYRIELKGVPMKWRTLISTLEPPKRFVDEQIRGPYMLWHHTHEFETQERGGVVGTLCIDRVRYKHAGGPIAERLLVAKDLTRIFDYRQEKMRELFV